MVDSAADVHVCNDKRLMHDYTERPTRIGGSTSERVLPGRGKVRLRPANDNEDGAILNLKNVYYLPSSLSNLVSLALLNDHGIYYNNEKEKLYNKSLRRILASAERWRKSFVLKLLNLSDTAANLTRVEDDIYQGPIVQQTTTLTNLPLTIWHKRLGHLNLPALRNICKSSRSPSMIMQKTLYATAANAPKQQRSTTEHHKKDRAFHSSLFILI